MEFKQVLKQWSIALTGGIACGKSTIATIIRQQGLIVVDADTMSRQVVAPGTEGLAEVVKSFGPEILDADGSMNRSAMRTLVFSDPQKRLQLEAIIHPRLQAEVVKELEKHGFFQRPQIWFYEASLIYERQRAADFKQLWVAYCPEEVQIERVMQRDRCSREIAQAILATQMPARDKADLADRVIRTDCTPEELQRQVLKVLSPLLTAEQSP